MACSIYDPTIVGFMWIFYFWAFAARRSRDIIYLVGHKGTGITLASHVADLEVARRHVCKQQGKWDIIDIYIYIQVQLTNHA